MHNDQLISISIECWDGVRTLPTVYDDGGRAAAGYKGLTGDCVCRSIAIATEQPYQVVYDALKGAALTERPRAGRKRSNPQTGVHRKTIRRYLAALGWRWTPTMGIGTGCKVHLVADEIPMTGRVIVDLSRHITAVVDGVIHDTGCPQRQTIVYEHGLERIAHRCVYGYWTHDPS